MNTRSQSKRQRIDAHSVIFSIVLTEGYIGWYELQDLQAVSKEWKSIISRARDILPDWPRIIEYIETVNNAHLCRLCKTTLHECTSLGCNRLQQRIDCQQDTLAMIDPRNAEVYRDFSSYEKARELLKFHQLCLSNILSFYEEDLTKPDSRLAPFYFINDDFCGMNGLYQYNRKVYWLLHGLFELLMASADLQKGPHFFRKAFARIPSSPVDVPGYFNILLLGMRQIMDPWTGSEMQRLEVFILDMLLYREEEADLLLGPKLADSVNLLHTARIAMIPKLDEIFPLQWMPSFGVSRENYVPLPREY